MDTLPLPPRPHVDQYRKRAKELVVAASSREPAAVRTWARDWLSTLARLLGVTEFTPFVQGSLDRAVEHIERRVKEKSAGNGSFTLADAQHLIAVAHGFANWAALSHHIERMTERGPETAEFEGAVDAVVDGNVDALKALLRKNPALIRERSPRVHRATLLHYVAANGVEDFRQKTPKNALDVARVLLDAGAEVDALAETYGGGTLQTTMNLLVSSAHPAIAGLQAPLAELLLDYGAAIDGVANDASPLMTALAFDYYKTAETLARRGARIDGVIAAAALGKLDLVKRVVIAPDKLAAGVPLVGPVWGKMPSDAASHIERALVWASKFGHLAVVRHLLDVGVDPASRDGDAMTALHWAAGHRHLDVVRLLLERGAPLEVLNDWGGTVLSSTVWIARNGPMNDGRAPKEVGYPQIIETLLAAGADARRVERPTGDAEIDAVLARYG